MDGRVVRLPTARCSVRPDDAPGLIRASGCSYRQVAFLLNQALGFNLLTADVVSNWDRGLGIPPPFCLQLLGEITRQVAGLAIVG